MCILVGYVGCRQVGLSSVGLVLTELMVTDVLGVGDLELKLGAFWRVAEVAVVEVVLVETHVGSTEYYW